MSATPTPEQLKAIECAGNAVVTARPGSGKTFTLVRMIACESESLLSYQGVIAISYTNKASDELKERCDRLGVNRNRSFFGTIDKFCIGQIIAPFVPHITGAKADFDLVEDKQSDSWEQLKGRRHDDPELHAFLLDALQTGKLPIGALGPMALFILDAVPQASIFVKSRYTSIYIDEYQDCGLYQHLLLKRLVAYGLRGVAVGDIDQAIFRFADKSPEYLLELINDDSFQHFQITQNHRCAQAIQAYSLALLGIQTQSIEPRDRRVFAVSMQGDEHALAEGIRERIDPIMQKYGVANRSKVAIIGSSNAVLNLYAEIIGMPYKRFVNTPLDSGFSKWRRVFADLLTSYYDSNHFSGLFLDSHIGTDAKPSKRNLGLSLLDEFFALREDELPTSIELAREIARLCEPDAEKDDDVDAYRNVVGDPALLQGGFRPAQPGEINILTYHKAKGLEFDIVFCMEAYRFLMPPYRHEEQPFDAYRQSLAMHYVGITRAKKVCYIMLGSERRNKDGEIKKAEPTEFLNISGLKGLRNDAVWQLAVAQ